MPLAHSLHRARDRYVGFALHVSLVLLASCSADVVDQPAEPPPTITRLSLESPAECPPVTGERELTTLRPTAENAPWVIENGQGELVASARAAPERAALRVFGVQARTVVIPGPFRADEVNRVEVELHIRRMTRVRVQWLSEGRPLLGRSARVFSSILPQTANFYFPDAQSAGEVFDGLAITLPRDSGPVELFEVRLIHEPVSRWLPSPGGAPLPQTISNDTRDAVVVTAAVPLSGGFSASGAQELRFSYANPSSQRGVSGARTLVIEVQGRRALQIVTRLPLVEDGEAEGWRAVRIPLLAIAGDKLEPLEWKVSIVGDVQVSSAALIAEPRLVYPEDAPKTILMVTSDTHRADHVGSAKLGVEISTPAMDELAARGVLFERALSSINITVPSHAALMTGLHPIETGILNNRTFLSSDAHTLAEAFRAAGFRTFATVSASHLGDSKSGMGQGFERHSGPGGTERLADETVDELLGWLEESTGEPLFVWLHLFDAHGPYRPPAHFAVEPEEGETPHATGSRSYRGEIGFLDEQLGRLLSDPRLADAIIGLTADHGEVLGNHAIWFDHPRLYMDTVHVPLILSWPAGPRGQRVEQQVQHLGLARTLLDLADLSAVSFPGQNLLAEETADDNAPLYTISTQGRSAAITHGNWHLILNLIRHQAGNPNRKDTWRERHQVELFDLAQDPGCKVDLLHEHKQRASQLRHGLIRWLRRPRPDHLRHHLEIDAGSLARLVELGYAGDGVEAPEVLFEHDCKCEWCERYR